MGLQNINSIIKRTGVDKAIAMTILSRIVQAAGALGSIFFIARYLSSSEQGYYYTFVSIVGIQVFFELGLSGIITQYTAHEFAHLKWDGRQLSGEEYHQSRVSSLLHFCVKWFGIISICLFFVLVLAGFYFFNTFNKQINIQWQWPWVILCLSTALNLFIDPVLAYFDGIGEVKDMAKVRLIQKSTIVIFSFLFFILGFKLYSAALAALLGILINYIQLASAKRLGVLKEIWKKKSTWKVDYLQEIFPLQWKIALSWVSGYFIFQLFSPVLFAREGPEVAGQMGMTLQALNGVSSISMSWITTKVPLFSSYISKKEYQALDAIFNLTVKQLAVINALLLMSLLAVVYILNTLNLQFASRFLPIIPMVLLAMVTFANQYIFSWATYLRCHKKEPFLINSIVIGILCCLSTLLFGKLFGLEGIVYGYSFISLVVALPWSYSIFINKRTQWHK